jgi:hypothetical protein
MNLIPMKKAVYLALVVLGGLLLPGPDLHATEAAKKLTCCQEAKAKNKECAHKCCIAAHKKGESCTRCNPNKEDIDKKEPKKTEKTNKS